MVCAAADVDPNAAAANSAAYSRLIKLAPSGLSIRSDLHSGQPGGTERTHKLKVRRCRRSVDEDSHRHRIADARGRSVHGRGTMIAGAAGDGNHPPREGARDLSRTYSPLRTRSQRPLTRAMYCYAKP